MYLGTLILWFCWYGFNCGSTLGMSSGRVSLIASLAAVNTTLCAAVAGLGTFLVARLWRKVVPRMNALVDADVDPSYICNGALSGLVAITAGCGNVPPWAAFVIGILAAIVYFMSHLTMNYLRIDDPLDAFSIHGACGILGVLCAAIFDLGRDGLFFGWGDGSSLWYNETLKRWEGVTKVDQ